MATVMMKRQSDIGRIKNPLYPQSKSVCTLGGNVATRAGGPRGVKYGTTGHYLLGLTVVLPDGETIRTGGTCVKQSVGYDLTRLMAGSEGTLGVITGAAQLAAKYPDTLILLDENLVQQPICIGVPKGDPDTLAYLNNWITYVRNNGFIKKKVDYWWKSLEWEALLK